MKEKEKKIEIEIKSFQMIEIVMKSIRDEVEEVEDEVEGVEEEGEVEGQCEDYKVSYVLLRVFKLINDLYSFIHHAI